MATGTGLLEAIRAAGFVYWGLFIAFGVILAAYLMWMRGAQREDAVEREEGAARRERGEEDDDVRRPDRSAGTAREPRGEDLP